MLRRPQGALCTIWTAANPERGHKIGVDFRFPGQGQRNTPVADARRIVEITILTDAYALCPHRPAINSNRCPQPSPSIGPPVHTSAHAPFLGQPSSQRADRPKSCKRCCRVCGQQGPLRGAQGRGRRGGSRAAHRGHKK